MVNDAWMDVPNIIYCTVSKNQGKMRIAATTQFFQFGAKKIFDSFDRKYFSQNCDK